MQQQFLRIFRVSVAVGILMGAVLGVMANVDGRQAAAADEATGAAAGTTGGAGRPLVLVTSLADTGPGTLRAAMAAGGGDVRFASGLSGSLTLASYLRVPSDTTLDGIGADVVIRGSRGLLLDGVTNVIIRNIRMQGVSDDAIGVQNSRRIWIDHVDLSGLGAVEPDGLLDVTLGSTAVTISWSRFSDHYKTMLLGAGTALGTPELVDITVHHNLFERTLERNPMMRHGRFHLYNNVLKSWGGTETTSGGYGMRAVCGALARFEANIFRPAVNILGTRVGDESGCDPARAPAGALVGNDAGGATLVERSPWAVPSMPDVAEPATATLEAKVTNEAGARRTEVPTTTTTASSTSTTTTAPTTTPGSAGPGTPVVTLRQVAKNKLSLAWTPLEGVEEYGWTVLTCDGRTVASDRTNDTQKTTSGLRRGCYLAAVRALDPPGPAGYSPSIQLQ